MTTEHQNGLPRKRLWILVPGFIGVLAFLLFAATLNHGVTCRSLADTARISNWDWHTGFLQWRPVYITPLYSLVTSPLSWLPDQWKPAAINLFSALCAAITLGLLAASVRLLPHNRTREQRQREPGDYAMLSIATAWIPIVIAVSACALQVTFWEQATAGSVEMFDLMVFAWLIYALLRSRISQNPLWLDAFAFSFGVGVCNNWALIGFAPFFLGAVIWINGRNFFSRRFLFRICGWGLAGLTLYLLDPLLAAAQGEGDLWGILRAHLMQQKMLLMSVPRWAVLLLALPSLIAVCFMGISWPSFFGDLSALGDALTNAFFRLIHLAFLGFGIWFFFDYKFSPRTLQGAAPPALFLLSRRVGRGILQRLHPACFQQGSNLLLEITDSPGAHGQSLGGPRPMAACSRCSGRAALFELAQNECVSQRCSPPVCS